MTGTVLRHERERQSEDATEDEMQHCVSRNTSAVTVGSLTRRHFLGNKVLDGNFNAAYDSALEVSFAGSFDGSFDGMGPFRFENPPSLIDQSRTAV